jgi:uncharacterized protein YegL
MSNATLDLEQFGIQGTQFGFSAVGMESLIETKYTLVAIAVDVSASVSSFKNELENAIKIAFEACAKSPAADTILIRLITFNSSLQEVYGYNLLSQCSPSQSLNCGGCTALYDACYSSIGSLTAYARTLRDKNYDVNGIMFIITDGEDNASSMTRNSIKTLIEGCAKDEVLESFLSILVGIGGSGIDAYMSQLKTDAGMSEYINISDANASNLAKLGRFISQSITSQSQALGTGGPSQLLTF